MKYYVTQIHNFSEFFIEIYILLFMKSFDFLSLIMDFSSTILTHQKLFQNSSFEFITYAGGN